jgi:hypothetical protein
MSLFVPWNTFAGARRGFISDPTIEIRVYTCHQLFDWQEFRSAFPEIRPLRLGRSFALSAKAVPTFEPFSPIANELASFVYVSLVLHPIFPSFWQSNSISAAELVFDQT